MSALITTLIDKYDSAELVRDKIAAILVTELANQVALATAASKPDPTLWDVRIFKERFNAWEEWLNDQSDLRPICNVWWDSEAFPEGHGNVANRQKADGTFNLDVYGLGISTDDGSGHTPGDLASAEARDRGVRLIRNILMNAAYTYVDLRGTVWKRWIQSIQNFQPEFDGQSMHRVTATRIAFNVAYNELSPENAAEVLEYLSVTVKQEESGEIFFVADYDYT